MHKKIMLLFTIAALAALLPCCSKKEGAEGKQAEQAAAITQPGEAEFALVRNRLAATPPSKEDVRMLQASGGSTSCIDPKTTPVAVFQAQGNLAVLQSEKLISMPGNVDCRKVYFLLKFSEGRWQLLDLPDRKDDTQPRLADINNDGFQDVIFFRNFGSDGPGPLVTAVYMSGKDGALSKIREPLFAGGKCERTDDIREDEYRDMRPCALGLRCQDGDDAISIEYDCAAGKFVRKVVQK